MSDAENFTPISVKYSHSFHSLEAGKGPMSFPFGHTHPGIVGTKSPAPPPLTLPPAQTLALSDVCICRALLLKEVETGAAGAW